MKYNKGFAPIAILIAILVVGAIGGAAYYTGKNQSANEDKIVDTYQPVNNNASPQQESSCLVITSPSINSVVSFPLTLAGYIDLAGAAAGTCTHWGAFEGTAGTVVAKDTNGNIKSLNAKISTVGDYYTGMQQWPVSATIQNLTGTPYMNEIQFHMTGDEQRDGVLPATQTLQPFTVTP
jgi:hypothetical protein